VGKTVGEKKGNWASNGERKQTGDARKEDEKALRAVVTKTNRN